MNHGHLFTISGVDGSGKSTQLRLLHDHLEARAVQARIVWHRPGYSPELDALRRAVRRMVPSAIPRPGPSRTRESAFSRSSIRSAWVAIALGDALAQYSARVRMLRAGGHTVLCDRYVHDARIDLELRFPDLGHVTGAAFDLIERTCSLPTKALLLMLPEDEMEHRLALKQEPFPDSQATRRKRYSAYQALAQSGKLRVVNASRPIQEVHDEILSVVSEVFDASAQ